MAASFALTGRTEKVRLSDVPKEIRLAVAEKAALKWGLRGIEFMELMVVAESAIPDAELTVDAAKAARVLVERKTPPGQIPSLADLGCPPKEKQP